MFVFAYQHPQSRNRSQVLESSIQIMHIREVVSKNYSPRGNFIAESLNLNLGMSMIRFIIKFAIISCIIINPTFSEINLII